MANINNSSLTRNKTAAAACTMLQVLPNFSRARCLVRLVTSCRMRLEKERGR